MQERWKVVDAAPTKQPSKWPCMEGCESLRDQGKQKTRRSEEKHQNMHIANEHRYFERTLRTGDHFLCSFLTQSCHLNIHSPFAGIGLSQKWNSHGFKLMLWRRLPAIILIGFWSVVWWNSSLLLLNRFGLALPGRFTKPRTRSRAQLVRY